MLATRFFAALVCACWLATRHVIGRSSRPRSGRIAGCPRRGERNSREFARRARLRNRSTTAITPGCRQLGAGADDDRSGPGTVLLRAGAQEERAERDDAVRFPDG